MTIKEVEEKTGLQRSNIRFYEKEKLVVPEHREDYVTNYLCFLAISVQLFTILFVNGILNHITTVFVADGVIMAVLLFLAWKRLTAAKQK